MLCDVRRAHTLRGVFRHKPKIGKVYLITSRSGAYQEVLWFDVAMNYALAALRSRARLAHAGSIGGTVGILRLLSAPICIKTPQSTYAI